MFLPILPAGIAQIAFTQNGIVHQVGCMKFSANRTTAQDLPGSGKSFLIHTANYTLAKASG
jgi:hypothetical protein